jgi:hypothetical protein
LNLHCI